MRALRATTTMHDDATAVAGGRAGGLRSKGGPSIDGWGPPRQYWRKLQQLLKVDADAIVARTSAARWASFAKTGDPNYEVGASPMNQSLLDKKCDEMKCNKMNE